MEAKPEIESLKGESRENCRGRGQPASSRLGTASLGQLCGCPSCVEEAEARNGQTFWRPCTQDRQQTEPIPNCT